MRLKAILKDFREGLEPDPRYADRILERELKACVKRATHFSLVLTVIFVLYGFTSYNYLHRFDPHMSLWANIWPRFAFSSMPMLGVALMLEHLALSNRNKLFLWITGFSLIFHAAAWIHVWPIALEGKPEVLAYVNAANIYLFVFTYLMVSPPRRYLAPFTLILLVCFVVPLFVIAGLAGDPVIFKLLVNDSTATILSGALGSALIEAVRTRLAAVEIEREGQAKKFLGPIVSSAIYGENNQLVLERRVEGFTASLDICSSTLFQKRHGPRWVAFQEEFRRFLRATVSKHNGYIQKTVGDRYVISFGVLDEFVGLASTHGLASGMVAEEERRLRLASERTFTCLDEVLGQIFMIGKRFIPEETMRARVGVDRGILVCGVSGDSATGLEFDINGGPVNCSDRLEKFAREFSKRTDADGSILVISPSASVYLPDSPVYTRIDFNLPVSADDEGVTDFPEIRWVLLKKYADLVWA
jgi:class 3 adenylate cyclase